VKPLLRTVNRVLVGLAGLVLVCGGGAVLAAGLGLAVPSWWPWRGGNDVLLGTMAHARPGAGGRWWPAALVALALVAVLALWWLLAQVRRPRLAAVLVDSGDGEAAVVRGRALEEALTEETAALDGVARARVTLTGRRDAPHAAVRLLMEPSATPDAVLGRLADEVLARARDSAGLTALPAEVRLGAVGHPVGRVS